MRLYPRELFPNLWLAAWAIVASLVAVFADPRWAMLAVPALLGLALLSSDIRQARLLGLRAKPSYGALVLAGSLIAAAFIVGSDDPSRVKQLLPILVSMAAVGLSLRDPRRRCIS